MNRLTVAVLGCGRMGEIHGQAYATLHDEARVFYIDADPAKAAAYAERFSGAGTFGSVEQAVHAQDVDLVDICLPIHLHPGVTIAALNAGKHVLVEKPMATTLADADHMICAARHAERTLVVQENFRYMPHLERAKALIAEGALGDVFLIEVNLFDSLRPPKAQANDDGRVGALLDVGHHFVDMAVQLGGPVAWIFARFAQKTLPGYNGEDTAVVMLGHASGVIGQLTVTIGAPGAPPQPTFVVCGTKASVYFDWQSGLWTGSGRAWAPTTLVLGKQAEPPDSFSYWGATIQTSVQSVLRDVLAGRAPRVSGAIGRHDLEIILAAQRSAQTGAVVHLGDKE